MKSFLALIIAVAFLPAAGCVADPAFNISADHPAHADAESAPPRPAITALDRQPDQPHVDAPSHQHAPSARHGADAPKPHEAHNEHKHEAAAEAAQAALDKFFTAYLSASALLARDDFAGAAKQFDTIHRAGHRLGDSDNDKVADLGDRIGRAAHKQPQDIKELRASLKAVSPMVIELMRVAPPSPNVAPVVREAYCPMAKAPWLQTGEKVANPYFGGEMPTCGNITQTTHTAEKSHK